MTEGRTRTDSRVTNLQSRPAGRRWGSPTATLPRRRSHVPLLAFAVALTLIAAPVATVGQIAVIDAANVVQTTISALKAIESVINEVEMIANQVKQIETMIQNTQNYGRGVWDTEAQPRLLRLGQMIEQEQAIAYTMVNVDGLFRQRYPGYRPVADWSREYDSWTRTTLDTLHGVLNSVHLHAEDFATEQGRIQALQGLSDSADGRMQALQLGNMMAGEQLQQLVKLRQLMMAQVNAQTVYMANQTNRDAQRAATQSEWIRNGNADAPAMPTGAVRR
jgi:type IV secretion system protein TrbJ